MKLGINEIIDFVLSNDLTYTGFHQMSAERTKKTLPLLEEHAQLQLIWSEFNNYLEEKIMEGQSIKIPNFGVFHFTNNNLINIKNNQKFTESFAEFGSLHVQKLIFQLSKNYKSILKHFPDESLKKKILQPYDYLEPKKIINWNPYDISKKCFLKDIIVRDGINAIFKALFDLVTGGKNVEFELGYCTFEFKNGEMKYKTKYF